MKNRAGLGVVTLSFLLACGSDPPPPPNTPEPTPVASASVAPPPAPTEKPAEKPAEVVYNFGKKAPAAGAKFTDKYTAESKDEKRSEERNIEVVTSDDKSITKAKITLVAFDLTLKGKTTTPNKSLYGKALTVESKDGKTVVMNDAGKPDTVGKFVATRRPPRIGEPLASIAAFSERPLKVGDIVEGDKLGMVVSEIALWHDETLQVPPTAKRDFSGSKATFKSVENGKAVFDYKVKEKTTDGTIFTAEIEYTGVLFVRISDSMVTMTNATAKGQMKIKDMPGPGGKKISLDLPLEHAITYQRTGE